MNFDLTDIDWQKQDGLVPAVIQHADSLQVLMLGYMNREALEATRQCGEVTFFSRSRQTLWRKGETSGNTLTLVSMALDCDGDTLLVSARPLGPTCHLQRPSCFPDAPEHFVGKLDALIKQRESERPSGSYTTSLFESGIKRIAQKVGEEGVETALAAIAEDDASLTGEVADLVYHLLVLLRSRGLSLGDVNRLLAERHG